MGATFYRSTAECPQCPSTTGARRAPGRNLECARGPQVASGPHRQLGRKSLRVLREEVCAGLRGAAVGIERRLDGSHWLRYRGRYLHLRACPEPVRISASPSGLRPPGLAEQTPRLTKTKSNPNTMHLQTTLGENHGSGHFYLAKTRTFLLCVDTKRSLRAKSFHEKAGECQTISLIFLSECHQSRCRKQERSPAGDSPHLS